MGRRRRHGALTGTTNRRGRDRQTPPGCRAEWFHRGKKRFATPFLSFRKPDPRRSRPGKPRRWRKKRHGWRFPVMGQAKKAPAPTLPAPVAALQLPALAQKAPREALPGSSSSQQVPRLTLFGATEPPGATATTLAATVMALFASLEANPGAALRPGPLHQRTGVPLIPVLARADQVRIRKL